MYHKRYDLCLRALTCSHEKPHLGSPTVRVLRGQNISRCKDFSLLDAVCVSLKVCIITALARPGFIMQWSWAFTSDHYVTVEFIPCCSWFQMRGIREDVEYYVDSNRDPDFQHNDFLYDDLDLDELSNSMPATAILATSPGEGDHFNNVSETPSSNNSSSPSPSPSVANHSKAREI